ncbi:hypothetical protein [Endozoicomonas atrinae]|uniref:hypothetical protein n=1 Tax=Endozoicomonas atrinae TaxID=1333660 RepID=UPI003B003A15
MSNYGFDQFQKYTLTELRELPEKSYKERFQQAHGYGKRSQTGYLEGRFAPKGTPQKMEILLAAVLSGYCQYLNPETEKGQTLSRVLEVLEQSPDKDKAQLALVAHFIKQSSKDTERFPYESLYKDTTGKAAILIDLLKYRPTFERWLRGIDAAANEMDTPPEVFAPLFRVLKSQGIRHATYHVGEDFPHLISGIRAIDDAMRFLPLGNGDRLGHCTAIGIAPVVWRRSLPPTLDLSQETRLLDLIFIWRELGANPELLHCANKAASEAVRLARTIFKGKETLSIELLDELFSLRDLYPPYEPLLDDEARTLRPASIWDGEYARIEKLLSQPEQEPVIRLYREWLLNGAVRQERFKTCEIKTDDLSDEALIVLQQAVMAKMVNRNVAIECPPTSNTRISQYYEVHEHHVFRWLGLPGAALDGDLPVAVCLASDDPGIFVTDLKSEFYHLFSVLTRHFGLSAYEALSHVARLNENGRRYRFHSPDH